MFKTFDSSDKLMTEVLHDRTFVGEGSATADRFPVRFVLFDNFPDCSTFVAEIFKLGNVEISRIEQWMDIDYPDSMLTHKRLADNIRQVIIEHPTEYRVIMPFSELARFYNNNPERAEFNTLINTIKGFDTSAPGYKFRQRVYIPIVGLEGKMQHFRNDSQSFIWYFQNPDHPDYRLVLTDNTTYGVQGVDDLYHVADDVIKFLTYWQYPQDSTNIISTSPAIYSHADYAQPDNAFKYCVCRNAYDFLTKGLQLNFEGITYREEESIYWEQLAQKIDLSNFKFEKFFNEQFGIHELQNYDIFYNQWFSHKEPFMRWLLAKYYTHRFCDQGYICRVLQNIEGYSDAMFVKGLALTIFQLEENPDEYLEERQIGLNIAAKNGVDLPKEIQKYIVKKIGEVEQKSGILSAIPYLSNLSEEEKIVIIDWYSSGKINKQLLKSLYPDLYYYLQHTNISTEQPWILDYIQQYKEAKTRNVYLCEVQEFIDSYNQNEIEHFKWSNEILYTRTILNSRTDIAHYCWIDGIGIDWIPFIQQIVKEKELENYYVNEVLIGKAKLPSRTENNKVDILTLSSNGDYLSKIGDLDEVAHSIRKYPRFIIEDLELVRASIHKMLQEHPGEKIAIVSDHGISYLSQLRDGHNLKGFKSDHYGRCALFTANNSLVKDDKYLVVPTDDGTGQQIVALRHESLMAKIPDGMGCHGGATPEEELVPIIIISDQKEAATWTATQVSFEIDEANPVFKIDIHNIGAGMVPIIEYNGKIYKMQQQGFHYTSERLNLEKDVTTVTLRIGMQTSDYKVSINLAVQEDDLFKF